MRSAERFEVLGVRLVRESRKGVGRGVFQPGPAKRPGDLLTGKGHENHPLTDLAPAFLRPELALSTGTRCLGESFPVVRQVAELAKLVVSADNTIAMTWVSQRKPSGNRGRIGRSIWRLVRISRSLGRPSRLMNPPGIRPAAYVYSR